VLFPEDRSRETCVTIAQSEQTATAISKLVRGWEIAACGT
jgi:hypothetical protein